jgi:hypothetical protein
MKRFFAILFSVTVLATTACTQKQVRATSQNDLLFPDGTYNQDIDVSVLVPQAKRDFDFSGVVKKTPEEIYFVGYNSFGLSLFKIRDHQGQPLELETSIEQINRHREFFNKFYGFLKSVTTVRKSDPRLHDGKMTLQEQGMTANVIFSNPDPSGVPMKIEIESPGMYHLVIVNTSYRLKE